MTRFRYKPEGPEARAWLRIALRVEKGRGTYWYRGLCAGICKARVSRSVRASMRSPEVVMIPDRLLLRVVAVCVAFWALLIAYAVWTW